MEVRKFFIVMMSAALCAACGKPENPSPSPDPDPEDPEIVTATPSSLSFPGEGGTDVFSVTANYDWTVTAPEWVTLSVKSGKGDKTGHAVTVTVGENPSEENSRTGEIVVSLPKGETAKVSISQDKKIHVDPKPSAIATADDFVLYMDKYASSETGTMTMTADIDMKGRTLEGGVTFPGVFDGQGHSIKNLEIAQPLFAENSGTVQNIVIDASCVFTPNPEVEYQGLLVGNNSGTISSVTNNAEIKIPGTVVCTIRNKVAPFAGYSTGDISKCINNGAINIVPSEIGANGIIAGGIVAMALSGKVSECVNNAAVSVDPAYMSGNGELQVGGFVGSNAKAMFTDCRNFGDVSVHTSSTSYYKSRVGGMIGWQDKVDDGTNYNILENCAVNCKVSSDSWEKNKCPQWEGGNDVLSSGSMVVGRMNGQSGKSSNLYFGTDAKPLKVAGTVESTNSEHASSVTLTKDNYTSYLCGGGSATNYAGDPTNPCTWQVWKAIYEIVSK